MSKTVDIAVEDRLSEAVLRRLLAEAPGKLRVGLVHPVRRSWDTTGSTGGYGFIRKSLPGFNARARFQPIVALIDADDRPCPPETIKEWLGGKKRHKQLVIRVAVREVEAWLLADKEGLAEFLAVRKECVPSETQRLKDPKRYIVRLAARSRRREIREDLAPALGTRAKTGPLFTAAMSGFARDLWNPNEAEKHNDSLRRVRKALESI